MIVGYLKLTLQRPIFDKPDKTEKDKEGCATRPMPPFWKVVYTEIIARGFIAGSLFYLLMVIGELARDNTGQRWDIGVAIVIFIVSFLILIIFRNKI